MINLRCTKRLLSRLRVKAVPSPAVSTNALGDWYANVLYANHQQLVICTNERSLLSVVLPFKPHETLVARIRDAAIGLFARIGIPWAAIEKEAFEMKQFTYAKTNSMSVLGSMNDLTYHCKWHITVDGMRDLHEVEDLLSEIPCGAVGYHFPREVASEILKST